MIVTEGYCSSLLDKYLSGGQALPTVCHQFAKVRSKLEKHKEEEEAIAFQGMNPHETIEAIRARGHGRPHHAQVTRRMTSQNAKKSGWYWS